MNSKTTDAALLALRASDADPLREALEVYGFRIRSFNSLEELTAALDGSDASQLALIAIAGADDAFVAAGHVGNLDRTHGELPVIVGSSNLKVEPAVQLMKQDAADVAALPCSQQLLLDKIRDLVGSSGERRARFLERNDFKTRLTTLTPAEVQVLELLLTGMANKQVSQMLGIGLRTVELRRSKIMRKMDSKTVAELIKKVCIARGISEVSAAPPAPANV